MITGTENTYSWESTYGTATDTAASSVTTTNFLGSVETSNADSALGDIVAEDHDRPPYGSFVFGPAFDGTCFILKANLLYYCKPKQPEYWPALYFIEVGTKQSPLITGLFHNGQTYVLSKTELYFIQGTGANRFNPLPMKAKTGAQSKLGAVAVAGKGIYHTGPDGIYLWSSGSDVKITENAFEPIFRGEAVQELPGVSDMSTSMLWVYRNSLYFFYQSTGYSWPTNVLVMNLDTGRCMYYSYNDSSVIQIRTITTDHYNNRLLIGDSTGFVRTIENQLYTADSSQAIEWEIQSKDFELQTRKHFPRWIKYDVDASSAASCTGALILDGVIHHSHTITGSRNTRRRLVEVGNGNRSAIRISGTGPVTIYAAEGE